MKLSSGKRVVKEAGSDEERRRGLLVAAVKDVIRLRSERDKAEAGLSAAKAKVEELSGLGPESERDRQIAFPGLGTVKRIWSTRKSIKRERLVEYLMRKLGATGEKANQVADDVTDVSETSYIDVKAEKTAAGK